jgi:hypothetical protein
MTSVSVHNYNTNKRLKPTEDYKYAICADWKVISLKKSTSNLIGNADLYAGTTHTRFLRHLVAV